MSSTSSAGRVPLFFAGRAREVLRKLRNEVLPDDRDPMMRMLRKVSCDVSYPWADGTYLNGVGSFRLRTLRGLLIVLTALLA